MSTPLDPRQLDAAWDALIAGGASSELTENDGDRVLFDLLRDVALPQPGSEFVATLGASLLSASDAIGAADIEGAPGASATSPSTAKRPNPPRRRWFAPVPARFALAALVLLLMLPAMYLVIHRAPDGERSIPAVSDTVGQGPPTSPSLDVQEWFAHIFSGEQFAALGVDRWQYMTFIEGTIPPGDPPSSLATTPAGGDDSTHAPRLLTVKTGALEIELNAPAERYGAEHGDTPEVVGAGRTTLSAGETLVYFDDALSAVWNAGETNAEVIAAGFQATDEQLELPARWRQVSRNSLEVPASIRSASVPLKLTVDTITVDPGETYGYTVAPQTLLAANFVGGRLNLQAWVDGDAFGEPHLTGVNPYVLHNYGNGYFTLSNESDRPVTVSFIRVEPPDGGLPGSPPATPFDSPFGLWTPVVPTPTPE